MLGGLNPPVAQYSNNGSIVNAKISAEHATNAHVSNVGADTLGRANSCEATDGLGIHVLH